jgi:hypothetical protein
MANAYLVDIHSFVSEKIIESEKAIRSAEDGGDLQSQQFYNGRLFELMLFRKYLSDNFNLVTQFYF